MEYDELLRLEQEKHRFAMEREQARETERIEDIQRGREHSLELARMEIDAGPAKSAMTTTEEFARSVTKQQESFGAALNTILIEESRQGVSLTENFLGKFADIVQTKLAQKEASRTREHERAMAILTGQLANMQLATTQQHELAMAEVGEGRAASDHQRNMQAAAHEASIDSGKYMEQRVLDFVLWVRGREMRNGFPSDFSQEELLELWKKFETSENA